jgi:uncharacterized OB-fold protein
MIPIAQRDDASAPFFDHLIAGRLAVLRCRSCQAWISPGGLYATPLRCPECGNAELDWTPTRGTGHVVSWLTDPAFPSILDGSPGQTSGFVELTEGPWVVGAFDIAGADLAAELPVRFEAVVPVHGGEPVPVFRTA